MINLDKITVESKNLSLLKGKVQAKYELLKETKDFDSFLEIFKDLCSIIDTFSSHFSIISYRFYGHTSSIENKAILEDYQSTYAELLPLLSEIDKFIGVSPYLEKMKMIVGQNKYVAWKNSKLKISDKAKNLQLKIDQLVNEVTALKSQAISKWEEKEIPVSKLNYYTKHNERGIRKLAFDKISEFYQTNQDFFYAKFIEIINLRNEFAHELGFQDFSEYSLILYNRSGYDYRDLAKYRDSVSQNFKQIFELSCNLKKKNLGLDTIKYYDPILFNDGPAKLLTDDIKENLSKYEEVLETLNPAWKPLFIDMQDNHVIDYETRPDKAFTGFANYLHEFKTPILFLLTQKNHDDIRVLTHEYGHTLQFHLAFAQRELSSLYELSLDCVEIFSHSMELMTLPYVKTFFGSEEIKYKIENLFNHLSQSITSALGDEFQELIYKEGNLTKEFIQNTYNALRTKYQGNYIDNKENPHIFHGNGWMEVPHYIGSPFYYIDYSLAIINALKIYQLFKLDNKVAIEIWNKLAVNIGDLNYGSIKLLCPELVNPFDEKDVQSVAKFAFDELKSLVDSY